MGITSALNMTASIATLAISNSIAQEQDRAGDTPLDWIWNPRFSLPHSPTADRETDRANSKIKKNDRIQGDRELSLQLTLPFVMDYDDALASSSDSRAPKIPLGRRGWAFAVDVFSTWFLSALLGGTSWAGAISFWVAWFGFRVIFPLRNRGQSPGRWAFDLKLIDERYRGIPSFAELCRREAIAGFGAWLAVTGLVNLSPVNGAYLLLLVPLGIDCGIAFADPTDQLAFHDRASGTEIVGSRRGYSLDLKVKKWIAIIRKRVQQ